MKKVLTVLSSVALVLAGIAPASGHPMPPLEGSPRPPVGIADATMPESPAFCTATILRVQNLEPISGGPGSRGCVRKRSDTPNLSLLGLELALASAETRAVPNDVVGRPAQDQDRLEATADVAEVRIGPVILRGLKAVASASCAGDAATRSGSAHVQSLTIAGQELRGGDVPVELALPGVGTLHLNEAVNAPEGLMVRALRLESPVVGDVVVAEATAGLGVPPCPSGLITIRTQSPPRSNQPFSFTGDLGNFLLDGRPLRGIPGERTFRKSPGRYRVAGAASADDAWLLAGVECEDPDGLTTTDSQARAATIDLKNGEAVVCLFRKPPGLVLGVQLTNLPLKPPPAPRVLGCRVDRPTGELGTDNCAAAAPRPPPLHNIPEPQAAAPAPQAVAPVPPAVRNRPSSGSPVADRPGWPPPVAALALALLMLFFVLKRRRREPDA